MYDFDQNFQRMERTHRRFFGFAAVIAGVSFLFWAALVCAIGYFIFEVVTKFILPLL